MTISLANILAYSLQLAALALASVLVTSVLRLRAPRPSLRFWQAILLVSLLLPIVQLSPASRELNATSRRFTSLTSGSTASIEALATGAVEMASWLLAIALAGAAIRMIWLAFGLARLRRITRRAARTTALDPLLRSLAAALHATATIAITDDVDTPATVGVGRPLILVPRRLLALPETVQRAVLAHELLHVRRRDWLHTIGEEVFCAVLWFHPAARLIASRLSLARETVVDEATILLTRDRRAYAEALLAFANPQPHLPGVTALIGRRQLSQRISLIAQEDVMTRRRLAVSLVTALLVAGTVASAAVAAFPMTRTNAQSTVYKPGDGVSLPVVVAEYKPSYTREAMQQGIQGSVWMDIVVSETGDVTDVKVSKSLDAEYGLDNEAVAAAYRWKFKPGMKDGKPVRVGVVVEMTFTLKK
jgi:TonB family protein